MDPLQLREKEIFETLKRIKIFDFVLIGGYAVNAYTLPRFSVDCDIVVQDRKELNKIEKEIFKLDYKKVGLNGIDTSANFARYEKEMENKFRVSFDVLVGKVEDRQTKVSIRSDWIFENSEIKTLKGKTINEELKLRIINIDALFVIKMISCRATDIRDLFMLAPIVKDKDFIRTEVSSRYNFGNRSAKIKEMITSKKFRDGLQGVYGLLDSQMFEKSTKAVLELGEEIS